MRRREFLSRAAAALAVSLTARSVSAGQSRGKEAFEVTMSEEEWRKILNPAQFEILRKHATERAGSSPLNKEHRKGTFHCAGCDLPVYSSDTKFDSGTGWPSFWAPLSGAIGTSEDRSSFEVRTEVHCRRCGGHLGHVFDDGPRPTGKRHCINGFALVFKPKA